MIRWLLKTLARLCLLVALAALGHEVWRAAWTGEYRVIPLGELWSSLHANSLIGLQTGIEQTSPALWDRVALPILLGPGWAVPLGLALFLRLLAAFAPGPQRQRPERRETERPARKRRRRRVAAEAAPEEAPHAPAPAHRSPWRLARRRDSAPPREAAEPVAPTPPAVRQPTVVRRS